VDADAARAVLGVAPGATATDLRAAYRQRLRAAHPDLAGRDAGTAEIVAAYRLLRDLPPPAPVAVEVPAVDPVVVDRDTIVADLPAGDLFELVVDAASTIGEVSYADGAAGLLEVVVEIDGFGACSVVVTLRDGTAWCTVEPLGTGPAPPPDVVAARLAEGFRSIAGS
jgi:hypothetical protein